MQIRSFKHLEFYLVVHDNHYHHIFIFFLKLFFCELYLQKKTCVNMLYSMVFSALSLWPEVKVHHSHHMKPWKCINSTQNISFTFCDYSKFWLTSLYHSVHLIVSRLTITVAWGQKSIFTY